MYFTIKYNKIQLYYKCYYNSDKCLYKKLFDVGQREVIIFIYVSYITRESTLCFLNVNKY
jgi:hypothetical protein